MVCAEVAELFLVVPERIARRVGLPFVWMNEFGMQENLSVAAVSQQYLCRISLSIR